MKQVKFYIDKERCEKLKPGYYGFLATLYALHEKGVKKVSKKKLHLAVYLSMKKLNYDCLEFT
jgi:hypothetical protein